MIPDQLIRKALDAWIGDHNCPHPEQIHIYRVLITRSLEAVAADIWGQGWDVGRRLQGPNSNPYRASEGE